MIIKFSMSLDACCRKHSYSYYIKFYNTFTSNLYSKAARRSICLLLMCGCRSCANPYGVRMQAENGMSSGTQKRKRRKHTKSLESGRNFLMGRAQSTVDAPWALFEELLCRECALHLSETEETSAKDVTSLYNKLVVLIKNNSVELPKEELINSELAKIEEKDTIAVERLLKRKQKENENFNEKMKQLINLNIVVPDCKE